MVSVRKIKFAILFVTIVACEGPEGKIGPNGLKSLIKASNISSGSDCPNGGVKIETGIDKNSNGVLDSDEIDNTAFVCNGQNGSNGLTSLVKMALEPVGINCSNGGYKIDSGVDSNNNGILDSSEITSTSYVCNGSSGTVFKISTEPNGTNCQTGGYKLESGLDINKNNILDNTEITNSIYICNGQDNYLSYIASINQGGTNPPSASAIKNTLNLTIIWTRTSQGIFKGSLSSSLDLNKTILLSNNNNVLCTFSAPNEITLQNVCGVNAYCDNFSNLFIEIKAYN